MINVMNVQLIAIAQEVIKFGLILVTGVQKTYQAQYQYVLIP